MVWFILLTLTYETIINSKVKTIYVGLSNAIFEYIGTCNMTQVKQKIQPYIPMPLKVFYKSKKVKKNVKICTIYFLEKRKSNLPR